MKMKNQEKKKKPSGEEKLVDSTETEPTSGGLPSGSGSPLETKYETEADDEDILSFDGNQMKTSTTTHADEAEPEPESTPAPPPLELAQPAPLDAKAFQAKWQKGQAQSFTLTLSEPGVGTAKAMEPLLQQQRINIMASGVLPNLMKYFLYAQDSKGNYFLIECLTDLSTGVCKMTLKADNPTDIPLFLDYLKFTLAPICKV